MHAGKRTSFDLVSTRNHVYHTYAQDVVGLLCTLHTTTAVIVRCVLKTEDAGELSQVIISWL